MNRIFWAFGASAVIIGLILFVDQPVNRFIQIRDSSEFQQFFSWFSSNGIFLFYALFAGLYGYARLTGNSIIDQYCRAYLKAQLIFSFAFVRVLKIVIGRMRPGMEHEFNFFSLKSKYNSFPSGHAADIFTGALLLYLLLRSSRWHQLRFLPLFYAALVAAGRVAGGWHYVSDVACGAFIGICGALFFLSRTPGKLPVSQQPDQC